MAGLRGLRRRRAPGGSIGLHLLVLAVFLAAMALLWVLTRPAESIIVRLLILVVALLIVTDLGASGRT